MTDLDQSGRGFQKARTYLGPSLGWVDTQVQPARTITSPGTYVIQPGDSVIFVSAAAGSVTIQLPDVVGWFQSPAYQPATGFARAITIKDLGNAATFPITIIPKTGQVVDNQLTSTSIGQSYGSAVFFPDDGLTGWWRQLGGLGGGGGSGNMVLPVPAQASKWISSIDIGGNASLSQPAFTDISGTLSVSKGGTGLTSGTPGGIAFFNTSTSMQSTTAGPNGSVLVNGPSWSQTPSLGTSGSPGSLGLFGSSGNAVTLLAAPATTSWSFKLPPNGGANGQFLQTDGAGNATWVTPPSGALIVGATNIIGGTSGSYVYDNSGTVAEKTPVQVTADLSMFTSTLKGLAPPSGGGTINFLRADGIWAAPPGGAGGISTINPGANVGPTITYNAGSGLAVSSPSANIIQYSGIVFSAAAQGNVPASGGGTTNFLRADGTWIAPPGGGITIGTTTITGGVNGSFLFDNAGLAGEKTPTQVTAVLDLFTPTLRGVAPASGGGAVNFLRADGTWAVPPGTGGGITSVNGYTGPAITISNPGGTGISVTNPGGNTVQIDGLLFTSSARGVVPASGGGTVNFLRADGTWTTPSGTVVASLNGLSGVLSIVAGTAISVTPSGSNITIAGTQFGSAVAGIVPSSGGGTANFLRADGSWAAPPGAPITVGSTTITGGTSGNYVFDSTGIFGEKTPTQVTADLNLFTSALKGLTPASGGGTANFLRADGSWAAPAGVGGTPLTVNIQKFITPGTFPYTPSPNLSYAIVECVGGGGGGYKATTGASGQSFGGGGGGSGGYARRVLSAIAIGASQSVTVGAGGAGGPVSGVGGDGGDTLFGTTTCTATGGKGSVGEFGGAGGGGQWADFISNGAPGGSGGQSTTSGILTGSGEGGSSIYGGGGSGIASTLDGSAPGNAGNAYGSGGGGAFCAGASGSATGGAGSGGCIVITEYIGGVGATSAGVTSLNGLAGVLAITAGSGIAVTPSGSNIQVAGTAFGSAAAGNVPASGGGTTNFLRADGTWAVPPGGGGGGGGGAVPTGIRVFATTQSYTPTAGTIGIIVECVGSGGGGGSAVSSAGRLDGAGGGGAGSYSRKFIANPVSQTITIGAGGAAGVGAGPGGNGGDVSFGSLCIGKGGTGGGGANNGATVGLGGAGGVAGTGDFTSVGSTGSTGVYEVAVSGVTAIAAPQGGSGGSSVFGAGGLGAQASLGNAAIGNGASAYGSGGGGAAAYGVATTVNGGLGSPGVCIVTEFGGGGNVPLPNYLGGLPLVYATVNSLSVAAGGATSSDNLATMVLSSTITKGTTATWAVGNGGGGLDTGAVAANTWYHVWLIMRPDTGVVDVLFSTSATSPTMPTNYTKRRRIGSFKTDAGLAIINFVQDGDSFVWAAPVADYSNVTIGTTAGPLVLSVPPGVKVTASFTAFLNTGTAGTYVTFASPDQTTLLAATPTGNISLWNPTATSGASSDFNIRTGTSSNINIVGSASATGFYLITKGWIDNRGK